MATEILSSIEERWPDPDKGPWALRLVYALIDGRPGVVGVELYAVPVEEIREAIGGWPDLPKARHLPKRPRPITTAGLRVPLAEKMTERLAAMRVSDEITANAKPRAGIPPHWSEIAQRRLDLLEKVPEPGRRGRPPSLTLEDYRKAAEIYNAALAEGKKPRVAVARELHLSTSGAGKRISGCRELGLLPPTVPGKAAGSPVTKDKKRRKR